MAIQKCLHCGASLKGKQASAKFCCPKHRVEHWRLHNQNRTTKEKGGNVTESGTEKDDERNEGSDKERSKDSEKCLHCGSYDIEVKATPNGEGNVPKLYECNDCGYEMVGY